MSADQENTNPQSMANDDLPDWLRELRGPTSKPKPETSTQSSPPPEPESTPAEEDNLPPWLEEVDTEEATATDTTSEEVPSTELAAEDDEDDDLWKQILAEEGLDLEEVPEDRPEGAENMSVRDWIAATSEESPLAQPGRPADAAPDAPPAEEPEPEPLQLEDDKALAEDELPDWLRDEQPLEAEESVFSWLSDETTYEETADEAVEAVTAGTDSAEADEDDGEEDDGIVVTEELPDWLREDQPVQASAETPAWLEDESTEAEVEEETETPSLETTAAPDLDDDGMVVTEELPDWLRDEQLAEESTPSLSWLSDESTYDDSLAEAEVETVDVTDRADEDELSDSDVEELPDWLQEEVEDEGELSFAAETEETTQPTAESSTVSLEDDGIVDVEGLPDWLRDEESVTVGEEEGTDKEVPDWLADVTEDDSVTVSDEELDLAEAEIPDWLQEVEQEEAVSETEPVDEAPEWLDMSTIEEDILTEVDDFEVSEIPARRSRVPGWLEKLRGDETDIVSESQAGDQAAEESLEEATLQQEPEPVSEKPQDQDSAAAKLSVATATLDAGDLEEALTIYQDLINESTLLDEIIDVLTNNLARYERMPVIYEILGDAQMRNGQLSNALESYRSALEKL
jgi:hypothetical protein